MAAIVNLVIETLETDFINASRAMTQGSWRQS